jgi:ATP-dependent helicase/nuclease subunit A
MSTVAMALPRELILASAGSGKTYRISSRIIGLLAAGEAPEAVFASTFTRKAAGEILERVLVRLADAAVDARAAAELAEAAALAGDDAGPASPRGGRPPAEPAFWADVLERTIRKLHRLNIGTLDAFFIRTARTFANEVGLPLGWRIIDDEAWRRLLSESLQRVLRRSDPGELVEIVRSIAREGVGRSVHDALLRDADRLLALQHDLARGGSDAWTAFAAAAGADGATEGGVGADGARAKLRARAQALAAHVAALPVPRTSRGAPSTQFAGGLRNAAQLIEQGDWEALLCTTLCQAALPDGSGAYYRIAVPDDVRDALMQACDLARVALGARYAAQARAHGRFARLLEAAVARRRRETGGYRFEDVTRALAALDVANAPDLYYRLDMRTQHLLLDEFQDTSLPQWEALEPIADELLAGHELERAAVIVADPKQSIYGWRGASPLLVEQVGARYALARAVLAKSWRSSQVVLDVVNRVFEDVDALDVWKNEDAHRAVAADWLRSFEPHVAAKRELRGYVELRVGPADDGRGQVRPNLCRDAALLVRSLRDSAPGRSIGVLTRTNAAVARIMYELRELGVEASEEGGVPLVDAAPVAALIALLRLADHPGHRVARYHVARSPLGDVLGFTTHDSDAAACALASRMRAHIVEDGYGATIAELAARVADACDARERRRLAQLVELAFRYDEQATLRTRDFVAFVETQRVEDATAARVRVMTVHQAKGLEFDAVVLPQLDVPLKSRSTQPLPLRAAGGAGRITHVLPYVKKEVRPLFRESVPELELAVQQSEAAMLRDALSGLYVALTRARHALYMIVAPDGSRRSTAQSPAMLVRDALAPEAVAVPGALLYSSGEPAWAGELPQAHAGAGAGAGQMPHAQAGAHAGAGNTPHAHAHAHAGAGAHAGTGADAGGRAGAPGGVLR